MAQEPSFEEQEAKVLEWLLKQKEVGSVVELAAAGRRQEAVLKLLPLLKGLLGGTSSPSKRRKVQAAPAEGQPAAGAAAVASGAKALPKAAVAKRSAKPPVPVLAAPAAPPPAEAAPAAPAQAEGWLEQSRQALQREKERAEAKVKTASASQTAAVSSTAPAVKRPLPKPSLPVGRGRFPLYWKVDLPEVAKVLTQKELLPAGFIPIEKPHTTLLYMGGEVSDEGAAVKAGVSVETFRSHRETLEKLKGKKVTVLMLEIILEENVACATVHLPPHVPCASTVPHITLGMKPGVPARYSNDILEEFRNGRKEGIKCITLPAPRKVQGTIQLECG